MDIQARHSHTGTGARKVRQVTRLLPGKPALEAVELLRNLPHVGARLTRTVLQSAIANAEHNHKIGKEHLFVKTVIVNDAVGLKRVKPRAFGRADTMHRGSSHIIVTLTTVAPAPTKAQARKAVRTARKAAFAKPSSSNAEPSSTEPLTTEAPHKEMPIAEDTHGS